MTEDDIIKALNDAGLAAFAEAHDGEIVTFCVSDAHNIGTIRLIPSKFPVHLKHWANEVAAWIDNG
jgi:hypothetical protein